MASVNCDGWVARKEDQAIYLIANFAWEGHE